MGYSSFPFNVVAGTDINTALQFAPVAVIVNNYSPYYIYLPDGLTFCSPWTAGVVIPLAHATQARATWTQSPFGTQTVTPIPGVTYQANLTFTSDPNQALSGGTPITPPTDTRSAVYSTAPGATLTTGALPFTAFGARIDNYTGTWYQIGTTGILVPPFTTGFTIDLLPPVISLILSPATPPYGPANNATGTSLIVTLFPIAIGTFSGNTRTVNQFNQTFLASGSFFVPAGVTSLSVFIVGGGGGGANGQVSSGGGGGGGGGEVKTVITAVTPGQALTVTIGAGGAINTIGNNSSVIGAAVNIIALGGGAGSTADNPGGNGANGGGGGGSFGGVSRGPGGGGGGMLSAGINGGNGLGANGGIGSVGFNGGKGGSSAASGGNGGNSTATGFGGGGGGGSGTSGSGGTGGMGAGNGSNGTIAATAGAANQGGGGGGGSAFNSTVGAIGGSGIVILSWTT